MSYYYFRNGIPMGIYLDLINSVFNESVGIPIHRLRTGLENDKSFMKSKV